MSMEPTKQASSTRELRALGFSEAEVKYAQEKSAEFDMLWSHEWDVGKAYKYRKLEDAPRDHLELAEVSLAVPREELMPLFPQLNAMQVKEILRHPPIAAYVEYLEAERNYVELRFSQESLKQITDCISDGLDLLKTRIAEAEITNRDLIAALKFLAEHDPKHRFQARSDSRVEVTFGVDAGLLSDIAVDAVKLLQENASRKQVDCEDYVVQNVPDAIRAYQELRIDDDEQDPDDLPGEGEASDAGRGASETDSDPDADPDSSFDGDDDWEDVAESEPDE